MIGGHLIDVSGYNLSTHRRRSLITRELSGIWKVWLILLLPALFRLNDSIGNRCNGTSSRTNKRPPLFVQNDVQDKKEEYKVEGRPRQEEPVSIVAAMKPVESSSNETPQMERENIASCIGSKVS
jgi:hypothetical protein